MVNVVVTFAFSSYLVLHRVLLVSLDHASFLYSFYLICFGNKSVVANSLFCIIQLKEISNHNTFPQLQMSELCSSILNKCGVKFWYSHTTNIRRQIIKLWIPKPIRFNFNTNDVNLLSQNHRFYQSKKQFQLGFRKFQIEVKEILSRLLLLVFQSRISLS